jgi:hypothetical protein
MSPPVIAIVDDDLAAARHHRPAGEDGAQTTPHPIEPVVLP